MAKYITVGKLIVALLLTTVLLTGCTAYDAGYAKIVDANNNVITVDESTRAIVFIDQEHHELHEGNYFTILCIDDLGNAEVYDMLIVAPDTTEWAHLVWEIEHELETLIQFYRDATYSDIGIIEPSFNRNGNSDNTATTLVYRDATITDVGTLVGTIQQGAGKKAGGSDRQSNEFILKQDTVYLIRITNLTANDNLVFIKLNWYERVSLD